jgi:hypothetical protein
VQTHVWGPTAGLCFDALGRADQAAEHFEMAFERSRQCGDLAGQAEALAHMGVMTERSGNLDTALQQHKEVRRGASRCGPLPLAKGFSGRSVRLIPTFCCPHRRPFRSCACA